MMPAAALGAPRVWLWSEFVPYRELSRQLPELRRLQAGLLVAVSEPALDSPDFYELWRRAELEGVPVRAWLLLAPGQGYWASKWNIEAIRQLTERFFGALAARGLRTDWVTLDLEPPPQLLDELARRARRFDLVGMWRLLSRTSRDGSLGEAARRFEALVEWLHARGIRVQAVTSPLVLHDLGGRHARAQSALGLPIEHVHWDEVSLMVYRAEFRRQLGAIGSDVVYAYARRAHRMFGSRAAVDLGEVGPVQFPAPLPGFTDPRELARDEAAARAAGIEALHVYSLDGLLALGTGLDSWLEVPPPRHPRHELKARFYLGLLDLFVSLLPRAR